MLIYLSGGGVKGVWRPVNEFILQSKGPRLLSYAYQRLLFDYCELASSLNIKGSKLLVDSGAFTAWTKGEEVKLDRLAALFGRVVDKYGDLFDELHLINLDRIPGQYGRSATREEIESAMVESMENFQKLDAMFPGRVLPVFHQDEPFSYLDSMQSTSQYVCLSPRNDVAEGKRVAWSQEAQRGAKYHGLATTGNKMMETVEWYSVDSASWVMVGGMGNIMWLRGDRLTNISISDSSPNLKTFNKHATNHALHEQIRAEIGRHGFDFDRMMRDDTERYRWNADILTNRYSPRRQVVQPRGLFDD